MYIKHGAASLALICMSSMMLAQFNGELKSKKSLAEALKNPMIVVDYYAPWCGPCKTMMPLFEKAAQKFDAVKFYKCDGDKYNVESIQGFPTVVFYKNGKEVRRFSGAKSTADIIKEVKLAFDLK